MVYEPWNLKHKKEMYEKKENWIVILIYLFWIILLFVYCNIINSYVEATIFYWGFIIIGFIIVTFSYFFLVVLFMLKDSRFVKMNKSIAKEYLENNPKSIPNNVFSKKIDMPTSFALQSVYRIVSIAPRVVKIRLDMASNFCTINKTYHLLGNGISSVIM